MKFLVPTDFSECAQHASRYAIELAKKADAEVVFLHLMSIPIDWINLDKKHRASSYPSVTQKVQRVDDKLEEWNQIATEKGVKSSTHVHYNESKRFINKFSQEVNADMIIMGSYGANEMKNFFVGTNTQQVVRFSKVPVLVIKKQLKEVTKVSLVSDFSDENIQSEQLITDFIKLTDSELHLTFVNTPLNFNNSRVIQKRLKNFQSDFNFITHTHIYNDFQFEDAVKNFCKDYDIDLLIMHTHGRKGFDRVVAGSLTENVIANLDIPVLCLPIEEEPN